MFRFRSMGTDVAVAAPSLCIAERERVAAAIADVFARNEARFSRFLEASELSLLNRTTGPAVVSPEMFDVLRSARRFYELTAGIFDPTIGSALVALGYDRPFAHGSPNPRPSTVAASAAPFSEVLLDEATRTVIKPRNVQIDLGGIVKGRTVDEAAALLPPTGTVDAGGDAVLRGGGASGNGWSVDVEDPRDARRTLVTLIVTDRAVATSGANRRRWVAGREIMHHLIDPRTRRSARSDLAQVTIVADRAETAEVLAKAAFVLGADRAATLVHRSAATAAIFVGVDGTIARFGELEVEGDA